MKIMMRAVESINTPIGFEYIQSRLDKYASSIRKICRTVSISYGSVVLIQKGKVIWCDIAGQAYKTEKLPDSSTSQQWFADIEIENCDCPLSEKLKTLPWNDGEMIVFELAPIGSIKGDD